VTVQNTNNFMAGSAQINRISGANLYDKRGRNGKGQIMFNVMAPGGVNSDMNINLNAG
jgi:hypothetical protein